MIVGAFVGFYYLPLLWAVSGLKIPHALLVFGDILLGAIIFWLLSLFLLEPLLRWLWHAEQKLVSMPPLYLLFGAVMTILGLVLAALISIPLWRMNVPVLNNIVPILLMILFAYMGARIGTTRMNEWKSLFTRRHENQTDKNGNEVITKQDTNYHHYKILDTNILIDGRIYDLAKTGFLEGTLLVPNFVLYELQYIADAGESIKRVRGRRGLDILNKLRTENIMPIEMYEGDFPDIKEVDSKLIALAKKVDGVIVTNDYNLSKVVAFQNVKVLNINALAKSLRPRVIPGEQLHVKIVKKGTERAQGVAYLDDGTMIVVEDGRYFMNQEITVEVTSALQTDAGRMIFARPVHSNRGIDDDQHSDNAKKPKHNKNKKK